MRKRWHMLMAAAFFLQLVACGPGEVQESGAENGREAENTVQEGMETKDWKEGDRAFGFTLKKVGKDAALGAETLLFEHEESGADVFFIINDDQNRGFSVTYRTPYMDETDTNHVFEHAVLASSEKYPSKDIFFDLANKTYNTYANAFTYPVFTTYPISSQSEEQLMKMADVYLSCMESPGILQDERFFQREAVRYELRNREDPITINGTVYSEDFGLLTDAQQEAYRNAQRALYPGETASNAIGQAHRFYRDLTYEHTVETYERCYQFDNSLLLLYGDLDCRKFLQFLDGEYLAGAKKGGRKFPLGMGEETNAGYVEEVVESPAFEGDTSEKSSFVTYSFDLSGTDWETLLEYDLMFGMLNSNGAVFQEKLREAGLYAEASCEINLFQEKPSAVFLLANTDREAAATFKTVVLETLKELEEHGLDESLVETTVKSREMSGYLQRENTNVFMDYLVPNASMKWLMDEGDPNLSAADQEVLDTFRSEAGQEAIRAMAKELLTAERSALITTVPTPGLAEKMIAERDKYLADWKLSMSEEELDQMIADTMAFDVWNEEERSNSSFMIPVEDLPAAELLPEVKIEERDGISFWTAYSDVPKIMQTSVYLDTSAIPQEDLHYLSLYTLLVSELDTVGYSRMEKENRMAEYLQDFSMENIYENEEAGEYSRPMLRVGWYNLERDYETSLSFMLELLQRPELDNGEEILRILEENLPWMDRARGDGDELALVLTREGSSIEYRYKNYMEGQPFYEFAKEIRDNLRDDPAYSGELASKLASVRDLILRKDGLIVMNVVEEGEREKALELGGRILGGLPVLRKEAQPYIFPEPAKRRAVIMEDSLQYVYMGGDARKTEGFNGKVLPFINALNDRYVIPQIRFRLGAYSAQAGYTRPANFVCFSSYRDPGVESTVEIFDKAADVLADMQLTKEDRNGYILNAYSMVTIPFGRLERHMYAMVYYLKGIDGNAVGHLAEEIKQTKAEDQETAAIFMRKFIEEASVVAVGNQAAIQEAAEGFDEVLDYRKPLKGQ